MNKKLQKDENGATIMNLKNLQLICEREELYQCPEHNETLYLHFKGFDRIQNLDPYYNLVALYLNNNAITVIEGLDKLVKLNSLFLNHNMIEKMQGLSELHNLLTLNLQHNRIKRIDGLITLSKLQNLNLSHNYLTNYESLESLIQCPSIQNLDLQQNHIEMDEQILYKILSKLDLNCFYLKGNPIYREFSNYRRLFTVHLRSLQFLDDKPVTVNDRRICDAFMKDGKEGEQKERLIIQEEKRQQDLLVYEQTLKVQEQGKLRQELSIKQVELCEEINQLQENEDQQDLLHQKQNELENIEQQLDDINEDYQKLEPWRCYMTTKNEKGEIIICNKSEEDVKRIKDKYYTQEILELNKSDKELLAEMKQKELEDKLLKEIEQDYQLDQEEGIVDQNKNYKYFLIEQEEEEEKPVVEVQESTESKNRKVWSVLRKGWTQDHDELLENLLMYHSFDFEAVSEEFQDILESEQQHLEYCTGEALRLIWTYIELTKYKKKNCKLL